MRSLRTRGGVASGGCVTLRLGAAEALVLALLDPLAIAPVAARATGLLIVEAADTAAVTLRLTAGLLTVRARVTLLALRTVLASGTGMTLLTLLAEARLGVRVVAS